MEDEQCASCGCTIGAQDIEHYETVGEAEAAAREGKKPYFATVVEKHVSKRPAHLYGDPDVYTTLYTFGDKAALKEGGWK